MKGLDGLPVHLRSVRTTRSKQTLAFLPLDNLESPVHLTVGGKSEQANYSETTKPVTLDFPNCPDRSILALNPSPGYLLRATPSLSPAFPVSLL